VSLAKGVSDLAKDKQYEAFEARGGVMEGERLSAEQVGRVSKWPTREEQLSLLVGQILGPGARLASQLTGPGSALASQISQKGEEGESGTE
jgi:ribosomal protein L10